MKKAPISEGERARLARRFARQQTEDSGSRIGLRDARRIKRAESVRRIYAGDSSWHYGLPDMRSVLAGLRKIEETTIQAAVRKGFLPRPCENPDQYLAYIADHLSRPRNTGGRPAKLGSPEQVSTELTKLLPVVLTIREWLKTLPEARAKRWLRSFHKYMTTLLPKGSDLPIVEVEFIQAWTRSRRKPEVLAAQVVAFKSGLAPDTVSRYHAQSLKSAKTPH